MVATNEAGARFISDLGLPFLFRNHEEPNEEKLGINFIPLCKSLKINPRFRNDNLSFEYRRIMDSVEDPIVKSSLSDAFLRCMAKAYYGADELGHFGLGLEYYAQLTSPIRRLPDLIDEHILHMVCRLEKEPELYQEILDMYDYLVEMGKSTSAQERRADQLERDVTKMKFAEYMQDHIGEQYKAVVSGFSKNGMFVQLPNTVEGMIPFTPLQVCVKKASKADSQIDFALIRRLDKEKTNANKTKKRRG